MKKFLVLLTASPSRGYWARLGREPFPCVSIYRVIESLERKGLISTWEAEANAGSGNRPKRMYKIEPRGEAAFADVRQAGF